MESRNIYPGLLVIAAGVVLLLANLDVFSLVGLWPLLVVFLGVFFFALWVKDRDNYGLLMPATILLVIGLLLLYCENYGWWHMKDLWPVFLLAPGAGFTFMYVLGEQEGGLLVPAVILLVLGIIFLSINQWAGRWWPAILILVGALLLLRPPKQITSASRESAEIGEPDTLGEPPTGESTPSDEPEASC